MIKKYIFSAAISVVFFAGAEASSPEEFKQNNSSKGLIRYQNGKMIEDNIIKDSKKINSISKSPSIEINRESISSKKSGAEAHNNHVGSVPKKNFNKDWLNQETSSPSHTKNSENKKEENRPLTSKIKRKDPTFIFQFDSEEEEN